MFHRNTVCVGVGLVIDRKSYSQENHKRIVLVQLDRVNVITLFK